MKKLIQICSVLCLVVFFSVVSASAQIAKQYAAEIPYEFNVGDKAYQAGGYVIKIAKLSGSVLSLSLEDREKHNVQTILAQGNGNAAKGEPKLVFTTYNNQRFLTGISMQERGLSIVVSKKDKLLAKAQGKPAPETATVASNK